MAPVLRDHSSVTFQGIVTREPEVEVVVIPGPKAFIESPYSIQAPLREDHRRPREDEAALQQR